VPAQPDLTQLLASMPFAAATGVVLERATPGEVTGSLAWAPERCTAGGTMHGGALMTLADSVGAVCAYLNLPPGASGTATTSSTTSFLRALRRGSAHATARPLHVGRTSVVLVVAVVDDGGALVAHVTQSQVVLLGGAQRA
jgi:uncharacterized protein (TIGR00369 family)